MICSQCKAGAYAPGTRSTPCMPCAQGTTPEPPSRNPAHAEPLSTVSWVSQVLFQNSQHRRRERVLLTLGKVYSTYPLCRQQTYPHRGGGRALNRRTSWKICVQSSRDGYPRICEACTTRDMKVYEDFQRYVNHTRHSRHGLGPRSGKVPHLQQRIHPGRPGSRPPSTFQRCLIEAWIAVKSLYSAF